MIKFGLLKIEGFCSIQNLEVNLDNPNTITFIRGKNGAGKTSILNALIWLLYGKIPKGVSDVTTKEQFRPKKYQGVMVTGWYEKDGEVRKLIRCLDYKGQVEGAKGGSRLLFFKQGDLISEKGKPKIQEAIIKDLGLSYSLFKNSIMFGQKLKRIAQESGPDKKALFEEAFELGYLTVAKQIAKAMKDKTQSEFDLYLNEMRSLEERYNEAKETYLELRRNEKNFRDEMSESIKEIREQKALVEEKLKEIKIPPTKSFEKLAQLKKDYQTLLENERELNKRSKEYTSKQGISEMINSVLKFLKEKQYNKAYTHLVNIKSVSVGLEKIQEAKNAIIEKIEIAEEKSRKNKETIHRINALKEKIDYWEKQEEKVKSKKLEVISPKYRKKRFELKHNLSEIKAKMLKTKKELEDITWVYTDPLGNSGIKTYIFDNSLSYLNDILFELSKLIGFQVTFTVDSESKKRDFVTWISRNGQDIQYEELSGGEQQLVDISMAIALHCITTLQSQVNILALDEVFESLDKDNVEIVLSIVEWIRNQQKSVYIITHQENIYSSNCRIWNVINEQGITTIKAK